jgi:hypothetical protein
MPMKIALLAFAGLAALAAPARAGPIDCGLFPDMNSRFACYDNISRAPKQEPKAAVSQDAAKPKAAAVRSRKTIRSD